MSSSIIKNMPETFHQFLQLPWEMREEIWNLATRPKCPGAHVFTVYDIQQDQDADRTMDIIFDQKFRRGLDNQLQLSASKSLPGPSEASVNYKLRQEFPASWTCNNPSTYLIDGGLWTACKESRMVMERGFPGFPEKTRAKIDEATATSYFIGRDLVHHYFTVFPHEDLFILQPVCLDNVQLDDLNYSIPIGSPWAGYEGIRNIAIEYNPLWGQQIEEVGRAYIYKLSIIQYFLEAVINNERLETIWLIDYGIKRAQNVPNHDEWYQGSHIFYQKNRRYVCVNPYYMGWKWNDEDAYDGPYRSGRGFLQSLEEEIESMFDDWASKTHGSRSFNLEIDLLACEYI